MSVWISKILEWLKADSRWRRLATSRYAIRGEEREYIIAERTNIRGIRRAEPLIIAQRIDGQELQVSLILDDGDSGRVPLPAALLRLASNFPVTLRDVISQEANFLREHRRGQPHRRI
jgi:hypothetical protein